MSGVFDLTAARFSALTALSLAQFSALAYKDRPEVLTVLNDAGMWVSWIDRTSSDTQLFVASNDDIIVVCFRGTAEPKDWLTDLKTKRIPYPGHDRSPAEGVGEVHRGFWEAYSPVHAELLDLIEGEGHGGHHTTGKPVLVAGHSLGGALAVIAADQLAVPARSVRLYTYGQPRVFDAAGVASVNSRVDGWHRFVNNNDVVPRVPFAGWGFRHAGRLNHLAHTGQLLLDPAPWMTFADRVIGRFKSRKMNPRQWATDGISDHSMTEYVRLINDWV